jgi:hypothetical protein
LGEVFLQVFSGATEGLQKAGKSGVTAAWTVAPPGHIRPETLL